MRDVWRWPGWPRSTWSSTSALARATEASLLSARLGVEQQTDPAHTLLLQKLEHMHDVHVARAAISGDHDRLVRVLRLPLADPGDQLVLRDAHRGRRALLQQERPVGAHNNLEWVD